MNPDEREDEMIKIRRRYAVMVVALLAVVFLVSRCIARGPNDPIHLVRYLKEVRYCHDCEGEDKGAAFHALIEDKYLGKYRNKKKCLKAFKKDKQLHKGKEYFAEYECVENFYLYKFCTKSWKENNSWQGKCPRSPSSEAIIRHEKGR